MAKAKTKRSTSASAVQRREQQRQERQQRLVGNPAKQAQVQTRSSGRVLRKQQRSPWYMIGGVLVLIALIVVGFVVISRLQSGGGAATPADPGVVRAVTQVDPHTLAAVGTGNLKSPLQGIQGSPTQLNGPTNKPEFFYGGGEFCPFCAGERWAMIVALSRFGTFSHLSQLQSAESNISTFTFYQSTYTSSYIDFVSVELRGNQLDSSGTNYVTLQTPNAQQQQLLNTYDTAPYTTQPGSIPFIDIANKYVEIGLARGATSQAAGFSPQDLVGLQWQDIANDLSDPSSTVAKDILGSANYLTAGICMATHQQPGDVCSTPVIQQIEQQLSGRSLVGASSITSVTGNLEAVVARQE